MRHLATALFVSVIAACSSPKPAPAPARPVPVKTAEEPKLKLSAPLTEWVTFEAEGFTVRFPPAWKVSLREKSQAYACNAEGHICFLQWGMAKFGAEELFGYLSGRSSTIKVIAVTVQGDEAIVWAGYDSDGDPWIHLMRFHQGVAFHFAYFGPANKVPDDFLMVPQTLVFKSAPEKPKDESSL